MNQTSSPLLEEAKLLASRRSYRRQAARTFKGFVMTYLGHYFNIPIAPFHDVLFKAMEDETDRTTLILGFRGSGKSTIANTAFVLWAALEKKYRFILVIGDTSEQAKTAFRNIRDELEGNELIQEDYGDMKIYGQEWQTENMILKNGVRILGRSRGQNVRGLRFRQFRPDLVIVDDPENIEWVRTKENRDKTERWIRQEVIPGMAVGRSKLILIGNLLHMDAILARLMRSEVFKNPIEVPLFDKNGANAWPQKFTPEVIRESRIKAGEIGWHREYLLKVIAEEGQDIKENWIQYYDEIPEIIYDEKTKKVISNPILSAGVGVDLAISKKETADYTTMVGAVMALKDKRAHIFVLPNPVNRRLNFQETIAAAKVQNTAIKNRYAAPMFFVEDVAYQRVATEMIQAAGIPAEPVKVGTDKRMRVKLVAPSVENGTVLFPRKGCEHLIQQLTGFGVEDHDDLVDAFVHLILGINTQSGMQPLDVIQIL